ncbi:MAG: thymidylate kinase [Ruminococcaceae bacterium]|nr:thymidylate kinase [Oscillospiraceae bacterium]
MLIVLEGVDSSGKQTQTARLFDYLSKKSDTKQITFPDYKSESSALVKMYLSGAFGETADAVSPYAASTFYAADRFASYKTKWSTFLHAGGTVICDRYTTSNMVHQAAKLATTAEKDAFLEWIFDLEYNKMGLPVPDLVFFLDMPPQYAEKLMAERANKFSGEQTKDIHERDRSHLQKAYDNAVYVAKKYNWQFISCVKNGEIRSIDDIHREIATITEGVLNGISSD